LPIEPLNLDDWAADIQFSSSGIGLPGSGGPGLSSSRQGSRFQSREPQATTGENLQGQVEGAPAQVAAGQDGEGDGAPPAAPKKPKKRAGVVQDTRTELRDDELMANRNNYLKVFLAPLIFIFGCSICLQDQKQLRVEVELRRQERDASRVIEVWMEGVPYGCGYIFPRGHRFR
jgi:hypothetical protein